MNNPILRLSVLALLSASVTAARERIPDLGGMWQNDGGAVVEITQKGNRVVAKYLSVEGRGFKAGDLDFTGTILQRTISAEHFFHYPIKYRNLCPTKWTVVKHQTLTISHDGDEVVGRYRQDLIHDDCSLSPGPVVVTRYKRIVVQVIATPRKEDLAKAPSRPSPLMQRPEGISVVPGQNSVSVGNPIHLDIWISGATAARVVADHDYVVDLSATAGTVDPSRITIQKGYADAVAFLTSNQPGEVKVRASAKGLPPTERLTTFCDTDAVTSFDLVKTTEQAPANGKSAIPMQIKFLDANGAPTTGNHLKGLGFDPRGVGTWRPALSQPGYISARFDVPYDECVGSIEAISTVPGLTTVTVTFLSLSKSRAFLFVLTWKWVSLSLIGGLVGAGARVAYKFKRGQSVRYVVVELLTGMVVGVIVMLAASAGMTAYTFPANGSVLGLLMPFLFGFLGGYAGNAALQGISKKVLPSDRKKLSSKA